ncbi:MAG: CPBP family intramembrane glutamic endopeptidase [Rhodococcus sp. (in: high G+C Gram-positive bacteria)]
MRIRPTVSVGLGVWALYIVVILTIQGTSGIAYPAMGDSAGNLWRSANLSLLVGGLLVAGLAIWMRWWRPALRDVHRAGPTWTLAAPGLYLIIALGTLLTTDWESVGLDFVAAALAVGILVGFAEEFVCRGMLVVGLRGSFREVWVWALSCVFFGLMHGINIVLGAPVGDTAGQIVRAAVMGSALYLLRRVTGRLVWAMLLHGLWDFSIFVAVQSGAGTTILAFVVLIAEPLALVGGFLVALNTDRGRREQYAVDRSVRGKDLPRR